MSPKDHIGTPFYQLTEGDLHAASTSHDDHANTVAAKNEDEIALNDVDDIEFSDEGFVVDRRSLLPKRPLNEGFVAPPLLDKACKKSSEELPPPPEKRAEGVLAKMKRRNAPMYEAKDDDVD